jgi:hypothetical protein
MWVLEFFYLGGTAFLAYTIVIWLALAFATLFAGFPRLTIRRVSGIVAVVAWACALVVTAFGPGSEFGPLLFGSVVVALLAFSSMWVREFRALMLRRDDEFPGRHDKLVWSAALLLLAPAGVWLFRSYRKAQWPDPPRAGVTRSEIAPDLDPDNGHL